MFRSLRIILLLCTFLGLGMRVSDLHQVVHLLSHQICDHDHGHDHDDGQPCHDQHHHHQCTCAQPVFGLPEFPEVKLNHVMLTREWMRSDGHWPLPEDPTFAVDIPPVIA